MLETNLNLQLPCLFALNLSTPLAQASWCKALAMLQLIIAPLFLLFAWNRKSVGIESVTVLFHFCLFLPGV